MDGFELDMDEADPEQQWHLRQVGMNELLQVRHEPADFFGRWRNELSVARARTANPILGTPKLPGLGYTAAPMPQ